MIRNLCFAALAVLFVASTSSANFVIDSFDPGTQQASATAGFNYTPVGYQGTIAANSTATITYDFTGAGGAEAASTDVGPVSGFSVVNFSFSTFPFATLDLEVSTDTLSSGTQTISGSPVSVDLGGDFSASNSLTFTFTNTSLTEAVNLTFGGADLTAVPEPTSLLMFPAAIGLFMARRRRVS